MEHEAFAEALAELGHPTRLSVFRLLARHAPCGVPATEIADALGVAPNTLSPHLDMLTRTGLIGRERRGRSLLYRLDVEGAGALVDYLAGARAEEHTSEIQSLMRISYAVIFLKK